MPPHFAQDRRRVWKSGGGGAISKLVGIIGLIDLAESGGAMTFPAPPPPTALHFAQYDIYAKICLTQRTAKVYAVNAKFDVDTLQWVFR